MYIDWNITMAINTHNEPNFSENWLQTENPNTLLIPSTLRVVSDSIYINPSKFGVHTHQATLYADGEEMKVEWTERLGTSLILGNPLVCIVPKAAQANYVQGVLPIERLELITEPNSSFNIFSTALPTWFDNPDILEKAILFWEMLDDKNKLLLNAVLLDNEFFQRFCEGPSSTNHHHAYRNGNLEHTLEVINIASENVFFADKANLQLTLIFAWLHDIGKADEYQPSYSPDKKYKLTATGYLHGHQLTGLYKVLEARAKFVPNYPESTFSHLRHLMAVKMGDDPLNHRKPQMIEHELVQSADILSAKNNLHRDAFCGLPFGKHPATGFGKIPNFRYEL